MDVGPRDQLSRFFVAAELFPAHAFPLVPDPEFWLTVLACETVLDPLRDRAGVHLVVNTAHRQAAGWRWRDQIQTGIGAAGILSDHCILSVNRLAVGAADIVSEKPTGDLFRILSAMMEHDMNEEDLPREVIWERRGGIEWLHVAFPEAHKHAPAFLDATVSATYLRNVRAPRLWHEERHRLWQIEIRGESARRYALDSNGERLT